MYGQHKMHFELRISNLMQCKLITITGRKKKQSAALFTNVCKKVTNNIRARCIIPLLQRHYFPISDTYNPKIDIANLFFYQKGIDHTKLKMSGFSKRAKNVFREINHIAKLTLHFLQQTAYS